MRTRSSLLTLAVSFGGQAVNLILLFASRRLFVQYFTQEYLGVNGLFSNILTVLSLAELGIGTAMIYGLHQPVASGDRAEICRLMNLYRVLYRAVGGAVLVLGTLLLPVLPHLVQGEGVPRLRLIYGMYLFDTVMGYFLSYKQAMLTAYQEAWRINAVTQMVRSIQIVLQMAVIVCLQNFYLYLALQMCSQLTADLILAGIVDRRYPYLRDSQRDFPSREVCKDLFRQVGALSLHRIGGVFVSHTDNLLISMFKGLAVVGVYSNYQMVLNSIRLMMSYVYNAFFPAIGSLAAMGDREKIYEVYCALNFLLSVLYGWLALCLAALFDPFIRLYFGEHYALPMPIVLLIVLDFYLHGMRQMTLRFRDGMGLYWYDRYKPVAETVLNFVVSLALVRRFGIAGVVAGTIVSTLFTNFWIEPLVLFRYGVKKDWKRRYARYFGMYATQAAVLAVDAAIVLVLHVRLPVRNIAGWILRGIICTALYALTILLVFCRGQEWRYLWAKGLGQGRAIQRYLGTHWHNTRKK